MKKYSFILLALVLSLLLPSSLWSQQNTSETVRVKNVILMITDGTSWPTLSAARWYKRYLRSEDKNLYIDPYISGSLITFCSDSPIGDSAPTTSCYVTGMPSIAGFVATYPYSVEGADLIPVDKSRAYRPMMTLLEAAKQKQGKKTGLVFTCEFPHATPADCSAHSYSRKKYEWIVPQMIHNNIDVVIGGGVSLMKPEYVSYLKHRDYAVYLDDKQTALRDRSPKVWQLYAKRDLPYDIDRDPEKYPSLEEMTRDALDRLSRGKGSENGFFLMIEGSKVDWAAHANDPVGLVTEFIAFDKAFKAALDFAQKDGQTAIIVTSDHGNSGFSIGRRDLKHYARQSKERIFGDLCRVKRTSEGLAKLLDENPYENTQQIFKTYAGFTLTDKEMEQLQNCKGYKNSPIPVEKRSKEQVGHGRYKGYTASLINQFFLNRMPFDFTTNGHTGEEVFLAVYAPKDVERLSAVVQNTELYEYMHRIMGIEDSLQDLSDEYFAPHDEVFKGYEYKCSSGSDGGATLTVLGKQGKTLTIKSFTNLAYISDSSGKQRIIDLPLATVYVDKTEKMYLSKTAKKLLE